MNYLFIAFAFCLPITKAGLELFAHIIILSFIFKGNFSAVVSKLKESKIIIALFLFLVLSTISVIWASDKIFALTYIKKYYIFLIIPIIYLTLDKKYIKTIFSSFLLGMLLSEAMSYAIFFELIKYKSVLPSDPTPFMNHFDYSIFLSLTSMIILNRFFFTESKKYKTFYFLYFLATTLNIFLIGGRTGQIIFIASLFAMFCLIFHYKTKGIVIAIFLAAGIITSAYHISPTFEARSTQAYNDITNALTKQDYSHSFGIRLSLWIMGFNVFKDNPILGTGVGDEKTGMQKYANKYDFSNYKGLPDWGHIDYHSMYVQHAVQLGVFGLLLIFNFIYSIFSLKFKSTLYRNIHVAFVISILIASTMSNVLHASFPMALITFFVAVLSVISRIEQQN